MTPDSGNRFGAPYPPQHPPPYPPPYAYGPPPVQAPKPSWRGRLVVLSIGLALLFIACVCPSLVFVSNDPEPNVWPGIQTLAMGWMGLAVEQVAWFANPVMVLSVIFLLARRWLTSAVIALVALIIASDTWLLFSKDIPADEGGVNKMKLVHIGIGCFFWLASIVAIMIGAVVLRLRGRADVR